MSERKGFLDRAVSRRELFRRAGTGLGALAAGRYLLSGSASAAAKASAEPLQIAHVKVRGSTQARLLALFDDTHARPTSDTAELLLWPGDLARLHELGFTDVKIVVDDVAARDAAAAREAGGFTGPALPGPTLNDYRRLGDYVSELKSLPNVYPYQARHFTMPHRTLERRTVHGVEIAGNVHAIDGRPTVYIDGIHHAREWPAGEYPMIFAWHLLESYGKDSRITQLMDAVRVIVVPIQNPDGFDHSRESSIQNSNLGIVAGGQEGYWRKNKRGAADLYNDATGTNAGGFGVDTNRNYPFLWGATTGGLVGDGLPLYASTSPNPFDQTYYGSDALSEPENVNVAELLLARNVVAMITNHTSGRLVLRPWGHTSEPTVDEGLMAAVGQQMATAMGGYTNQIGLGLYPTTGTTDDWYYAAAAAIGYTFEHSTSFHPSYTAGQHAVRNFWPNAIEAFVILMEAAADPAKHCVIRGRAVDASGGADPAPVVASLNLHKEFDTPMWDAGTTGVGPLLTGKDSTHEVIDLNGASALDGEIEWHVNPSTRPLEAAASKTETYHLTISAPGYQPVEQDVSFRRGDVLDLGQIPMQPA